MSINRRQFIKLAGISTILGIGGVAAVDKMGGKVLEAAHEGMQESEFPAPLTAKRWAMVVDLSKLKTPEDYQRCIDACNNIHNIPDFGNAKDEIKWIWRDSFEAAFPGQLNEYLPEEIKGKPFLLLCNHCENPPCVRVCPTKATFKRKDGIVMMDQHRCIGCRFCMAACPFGARSFNWRDPRPYIKKENLEYPTRTIGVVEKCTFCFERLVKGQQPKCVEDSNGALVFGDLSDPNSEVRKILATRYSIRRKVELGTQPGVYYLIGGNENA
jgi:molybdopterin-containing oxidoreductase family iron-sulfur binding subunit